MEETYYRCQIIAPSGHVSMVTSNFERPGIDLTSWVTDVSEYHYSRGDQVATTLGSLKKVAPRARRVGIESDGFVLTPQKYGKILSSIKGAELVEASDLVRTLRRVKSRKELEYTRRAAEITCMGMKAAIDAVRPGAKDLDVAAEAYRVMTKNGSEYMCYAPFVTTGRRSGVPHTTFMGFPIKERDNVFLELGAVVKRYNGPLMRTVHVGPAPKDAAINAEALIAVLNETIDSIAPGLACDEVARKVQRRGIRAVGSRIISPSLVDGDFGYGIGLGFPPFWGSDGPLVSLTHKTTLEPGMVFHLNETLREVGVYGMSFSETVVVTKGGCEVLTDYPREFIGK